MPLERVWRFRALTDMWTGSVYFVVEEDGKGKKGVKGKINHDRLITTGLLGSIRWWFEVVVRGLGGHACDPTNTKCEGRNHCVVCELFGCTGWARKFRFDVLDGAGNVKKEQIREGDEFQLRFTPLRPISDEEWTLLDMTLRLIADYGAIGGKTVFKPSDEEDRKEEEHHQDFGLVKIVFSAQLDRKNWGELVAYLSKWQKFDHDEFEWASLQYFWCVKGKYLARKSIEESTFNRVLGREEEKKWRSRNPVNDDCEVSKWLAGSQRESKKVFSFKDPARTFGFMKPGLISEEEIKERLRRAWPDFQDNEFIKGPGILNRLFEGEAVDEV